MSRLKTPQNPNRSQPPLQKRRRSRLGSPKTLFCLVALGVTLALAKDWLPFLLDFERLSMTLTDLGPWSGLIFMGLHIFATVVGVPGVILTMVGGIYFGLFWGSLWSLFGATLGAIAAFGLARYWMHDWFNLRCGHHALLKSLNQMVSDRPLWLVLTIRFAPISPFNLLNFLLGLTKISLKSYTLGTFFGIIPGVIIYTWFGHAGQIALNGQGWMPLALAGSALAALSAIPLLLRKPAEQV